MDVERAIRERCTVKRFSGAPLAREAIEGLLDLAVWAPNHGLTEPWRFAVVHGLDARRALAERVDLAYAALAKPGDDAALARLANKRADLRARIEACGALVFVTSERAADAEVDRESYAATCCAVQNLLLAATGRGLAGYWSTGRPLRDPAVRAWLGLGGDDERAFVAAVFLGEPAPGGGARERRRTPASALTRWPGSP